MKDGQQVIRLFCSRFTQPFSEEVRERYRAQIAFDPRFATKQYRRWRDTQAHLIGRLLLRQCWVALGEDKQPVPPLLYSEYERPYFAGGPDFSISHSGEYVLCALSDGGQIGIDIEKIRPINLAEMQPSFSPSEWAEIIAAAQPNHRLFDYWTRKEAVVKADGRGMAVADRIVLSDNKARIEDQRWSLQPLSVADGYCACLASEAEANPVTMTYVNFDVD